jgi:hypothetical protein
LLIALSLGSHSSQIWGRIRLHANPVRPGSVAPAPHR